MLVSDVANEAGLATGQSHGQNFVVTSADQALKVTLAWTDPPAMPVAGIALINDLDLVVTAPDGTTYRGNQWTPDDIDVPGDVESLPNAAARDALNNVEGVLLRDPLPGLYTVTVSAFDVPGVNGTPAQGFALAMTGAVMPSAAPLVPDGIFGAAMAAGAGLAPGSIDVSWDTATCPAADYNLLYGSLESVAASTPGGSLCGLGTAGTATWDAPPAGDLWFLIVSADGQGLEGGWGHRSDGTSRDGGAHSGECATTLVDTTASCP